MFQLASDNTWGTEVLGQLLALRKELQQEALDAQFSAEHFRSRVCSFDPSTAAVARRAHDRAAADSFRIHEEVMAQISMEEVLGSGITVCVCNVDSSLKSPPT